MAIIVNVIYITYDVESRGNELKNKLTKNLTI